MCCFKKIKLLPPSINRKISPSGILGRRKYGLAPTSVFSHGLPTDASSAPSTVVSAADLLTPTDEMSDDLSLDPLLAQVFPQAVDPTLVPATTTNPTTDPSKVTTTQIPLKLKHDDAGKKDVLDILQRMIDWEPPSSQDTNLDSVGKRGDDTHSLKDTDLVGKSGADSLRTEKEQQGGDPLLEHLVEMFPSHRRSSLATKLAQCNNNLQDAVEAVLWEESEPERGEIPQQQPQPNADRDLKEQEKRKRQLAKQKRKRSGATWGGGYQGAIRNRNGYTKWQCLMCGLAGPHRCFERAVTTYDEEGDWENSLFLMKPNMEMQLHDQKEADLLKAVMTCTETQVCNCAAHQAFRERCWPHFSP